MKKRNKELEIYTLYFIVEKLYEIAQKTPDDESSLQLLVLGKMLEDILKVKKNK